MGMIEKLGYRKTKAYLGKDEFWREVFRAHYRRQKIWKGALLLIFALASLLPFIILLLAKHG